MFAPCVFQVIWYTLYKLVQYTERRCQMREQEKPMTKIMQASQVREQWSSVINGVYKGETRILVEKSGIPVVGVVSAADLERLQRLDEEQAADLATLERISRKAFAGVPPEEVEREVDKAVTEVRAEMRSERTAQARSSHST
jgi:prevent-host-death family protein